jgi:thymidylate synthase ThyX
MPGESFTPEEKEKLAPYFTSLEDDVFGLKLPQEVAGALFSRYSRSSKSIRRILLEEFLGSHDLALGGRPDGTIEGESGEAALKKARDFYDRVLVGYGDDSVAQLGGAHIACENVSNLAANILEDARIGIAPLEKSTRYVRFDRKNKNGEYPYYREPRILASASGSEYVEVMDHIFDAYSGNMEAVIRSVQELLPVSQAEFKHPRTGEPLEYREAVKDPELKKWAESAYRSTVRAHACDVLRSLLPMATVTNVGLFGTGQAFEYLISKCYSLPLQELRSAGEAMHRSLNRLIPSFVKRARPNEYLSGVKAAPGILAKKVLKEGAGNETEETVRLVDYDALGEEKVLSAILFPGSSRSLRAIRGQVERLAPDARKEILSEYIGRRRNRRDKPGRALENAVYTFEILCNIGIYRDLHRHRILTQERQRLTVAHGYDTPPEISEMGLAPVFDECMERAAGWYRKAERLLPEEAQYGVPFGYRVRWYVTLNLRELYHVTELRSLPQGHPDYRLVAQEMMKKVGAVHPNLAAHATFVDWRTYRLGRLQSELRTEYKKSILSESGSGG